MMQTAALQTLRDSGRWPLLLPWLAFLLLYTPVYWRLLTVTWAGDESAYGYIILALAGWLFWQRGQWLLAGGAPANRVGIAVLCSGLLLQVFARSQDVFALEVLSQIPVIAGLLLCTGGVISLRALAFPLAYLVFLVPVPPVLLELVTGPLKQLVSAATAELLFAAGYPIARSGVVLQVGGYRLLVADACSGLNSVFSLYALGLVYLYLMRRALLRHGLPLALAILPIACVANIVRVVLLVLITFHFGHDAGQGFLHGGASLVLLVTALVLFLLLDEGLVRWRAWPRALRPERRDAPC